MRHNWVAGKQQIGELLVTKRSVQDDRQLNLFLEISTRCSDTPPTPSHPTPPHHIPPHPTTLHRITPHHTPHHPNPPTPPHPTTTRPAPPHRSPPRPAPHNTTPHHTTMHRSTPAGHTIDPHCHLRLNSTTHALAPSLSKHNTTLAEYTPTPTIVHSPGPGPYLATMPSSCLLSHASTAPSEVPQAESVCPS